MTELSYVSPGVDMRLPKRERTFFRASVLAGLLPMSIGVVIVLAFWITDNPSMITVGLLMLPTVIGMVLMGLAVTAIWAVQAARLAKALGRKRPWTGITLMVLLQLSNFPAAYACAIAGLSINSAPELSVFLKNDSVAPVSNWIVDTGDGPLAMGAVGIGTQTWHRVRMRRVKEVKIDIEQGGVRKHLEQAIRPDVRSDGGYVEVTVKPGFELDSVCSKFIPH